MKRTERDVFSPNTGKKYVKSPEHTKQRTDEFPRRRNKATNQLDTLPAKLAESAWTPQEDEKLVRGAVTTDCNWKKVHALLQHRTMDQCQLRWQEIGAKRIGEHWTNAEDKALSDIVLNNEDMSWSSIADGLLARTGSLRLVRQCRDRWNLVLEPAAKKERERIDSTGEGSPSDDDDSSESDIEDDGVSPKHIQLSSPRWEDLPSIGSAGHNHGLCKRCCFFPKGRCLNGYACNFCHFSHEKRIRKNKHKNRRERERARKTDRNVGEESWSSEWRDEWCNREDSDTFQGYPMEFPGRFQIPPGPMSPMVGFHHGRCVPCMPLDLERRNSNVSDLQFTPMGVDSTPFMPGHAVVFGCSRQTSFQSVLTDMQPVYGENCQEFVPNTEPSCESTEPPATPVNPEEAMEVLVYLEGMSEEYQFTKDDLMGFFGAYGEVSEIILHQGGGGNVKFGKAGVAMQVSQDLNRIALPALGGILCVKLI